MHAPPDVEMRRGAVGSGTPKFSQSSLGSTLNAADIATEPTAFQVRKLRRLFDFSHETARVIATLAYEVQR
jgi:hypothetical protein